MKQAYKLFSILFLMMAFAIPFTSCSDDKDDEPADPATHDQELIGTWKYSFQGASDKITFRNNGTGRWEFYESSEGESDSWWFEFTWSTEDGILTTNCTASEDPEDVGDTETWVYRIDEGTLYLDNDRYYRE